MSPGFRKRACQDTGCTPCFNANSFRTFGPDSLRCSGQALIQKYQKIKAQKSFPPLTSRAPPEKIQDRLGFVPAHPLLSSLEVLSNLIGAKSVRSPQPVVSRLTLNHHDWTQYQPKCKKARP